MKHIREDYNRRIQDNENLIPEDEPVFLIRAQDKYAVNVVSYWASCMADKDINQSIQAMEHVKEILEWQKINGYKVADSPEEQK